MGRRPAAASAPRGYSSWVPATGRAGRPRASRDRPRGQDVCRAPAPGPRPGGGRKLAPAVRGRRVAGSSARVGLRAASACDRLRSRTSGPAAGSLGSLEPRHTAVRSRWAAGRVDRPRCSRAGAAWCPLCHPSHSGAPGVPRGAASGPTRHRSDHGRFAIGVRSALALKFRDQRPMAMSGDRARRRESDGMSAESRSIATASVGGFTKAWHGVAPVLG